MNADSYGDALDCTLKEITKLREQVAAQAAVIEKLRRVMELAVNSYGVMLLSDPPQDAWKSRGVTQEIREALAIPADSTQILAEVRRAEREKCAEVCESHPDPEYTAVHFDCARLIRAME